MSECINPQFRAQVDAKLDKIVEEYFKRDPYARKHVESTELNTAYFVRQTIEMCLRIRLRRMVDAMVIHHFTKHDPRQAKNWAKYTEEEMLHDTLFAMDLERFGVSREEIYKTEPFLSTKLLQGYLYYTLEHEGPMGTLVYSYSTEYTSRKTQPAWLDHLEKIVGKEKVHGARAHLNYDVDEGHSHFVWNVLMSQVKTPEDERRLLAHMDNIFGLICGYSYELFVTTIQGQPAVPADTVVNVTRAAMATATPDERAKS
jgi:hypothetical protein